MALKMTENNQKKGRVILTYGRSLMALTAAHSLGERGIEIIGCDDVDMTVLSFSNYTTNYFTHAPYQSHLDQYLDDMEENIKKYKPDDDRPYILMPMFRDAKIIAKFKERFEPFITVATPDYDTIRQITPKSVFADTCERLGLTIPLTLQPQDESELESLLEEIEYPVLVKTIDGVGGRGITKAHNEQELRTQYKESVTSYGTSPLIQEVIDGKDYCLTAICDRGKIVSSMAYTNIYQFPRGTGAGIMRETISEQPFIEASEKLLGSLGWHGIAQIDFRWTGKESDDVYLIESNPRFWAGLFHSVESGIDYPWLLFQLMAYGKITDMQNAIIGKKTKVPGLWALPALQDIVDNATHFEKLKSAWADIWKSNSNESWRERISMLSQALKETIDTDDIRESYKKIEELGNSATSEFSMDEDPKTGLGFLFIASSILRHGELPPEIKN